MGKSLTLATLLQACRDAYASDWRVAEMANAAIEAHVAYHAERGGFPVAVQCRFCGGDGYTSLGDCHECESSGEVRLARCVVLDAIPRSVERAVLAWSVWMEAGCGVEGAHSKAG